MNTFHFIYIFYFIYSYIQPSLSDAVCTEQMWINELIQDIAYNGKLDCLRNPLPAPEKETAEEQRKRLTGSLGNLLPLSKRINSKMQNYDFEIKKNGKESDNEKQSRRGYINGSFNEIEVSQKEEWTPREILDRGLKIVDFMQEEWDFRFPSNEDKIKFLGLDFMINNQD